MDNLRVLLDIRRMDKVPNAWIRESCGMMKRVDKKIAEGVLKQFGHLERMGDIRLNKRIYI